MTVEFRPLDLSWIPQIVELRRICYFSKYGADVQIKFLEFNDIDRLSTHFGAIENGQLMSVFRATIVDSEEMFKRILLIDPPELVHLPIGTLARATTRPGALRRGFHSRLRFEALKWFQQNQIQQVWGTLSQDAYQLNQMKQLGYDLRIDSSAHSKVINYKESPIIGMLDLNKNAENIERYFQKL